MTSPTMCHTRKGLYLKLPSLALALLMDCSGAGFRSFYFIYFILFRAEVLASEIKHLQAELGDYNTVISIEHTHRLMYVKCGSIQCLC